MHVDFGRLSSSSIKNGIGGSIGGNSCGGYLGGPPISSDSMASRGNGADSEAKVWKAAAFHSFRHCQTDAGHMPAGCQTDVSQMLSAGKQITLSFCNVFCW